MKSLAIRAAAIFAFATMMFIALGALAFSGASAGTQVATIVLSAAGFAYVLREVRKIK